MTELLFNEDSYLKEAEASIIAVEENFIKLDRTIFYAESGGQPGDQGEIVLKDQVLKVIDTKKGSRPNEILHIVDSPIDESLINQSVGLKINWDLRYAHMKMHSSCHILCSLVDALITGASVGSVKSRIDFDIDPSMLNKEELNEKIIEIINKDYPIIKNQITGDELKSNPQLSRGAAVSPPAVDNKVQIVQIGEGENIRDIQACSGTHCSSTNEIGALEIGKIENKGKRNRRINIRFKSK